MSAGCFFAIIDASPVAPRCSLCLHSRATLVPHPSPFVFSSLLSHHPASLLNSYTCILGSLLPALLLVAIKVCSVHDAYCTSMHTAPSHHEVAAANGGLKELSFAGNITLTQTNALNFANGPHSPCLQPNCRLQPRTADTDAAHGMPALNALTPSQGSTAIHPETPLNELGILQQGISQQGISEQGISEPADLPIRALFIRDTPQEISLDLSPALPIDHPVLPQIPAHSSATADPLTYATASNVPAATTDAPTLQTTPTTVQPVLSTSATSSLAASTYPVPPTSIPSADEGDDADGEPCEDAEPIAIPDEDDCVGSGKEWDGSGEWNEEASHDDWQSDCQSESLDWQSDDDSAGIEGKDSDEDCTTVAEASSPDWPGRNIGADFGSTGDSLAIPLDMPFRSHHDAVSPDSLDLLQLNGIQPAPVGAAQQVVTSSASSFPEPSDQPLELQPTGTDVESGLVPSSTMATTALDDALPTTQPTDTPVDAPVDAPSDSIPTGSSDVPAEVTATPFPGATPTDSSSELPDTSSPTETPLPDASPTEIPPEIPATDTVSDPLPTGDSTSVPGPVIPSDTPTAAPGLPLPFEPLPTTPDSDGTDDGEDDDDDDDEFTFGGIRQRVGNRLPGSSDRSSDRSILGWVRHMLGLTASSFAQNRVPATPVQQSRLQRYHHNAVSRNQQMYRGLRHSAVIPVSPLAPVARPRGSLNRLYPLPHPRHRLGMPGPFVNPPEEPETYEPIDEYTPEDPSYIEPEDDSVFPEETSVSSPATVEVTTTVMRTIPSTTVLTIPSTTVLTVLSNHTTTVFLTKLLTQSSANVGLAAKSGSQLAQEHPVAEVPQPGDPHFSNMKFALAKETAYAKPAASPMPATKGKQARSLSSDASISPVPVFLLSILLLLSF